jgi:hypothetical protein
VAPPPRLVNPPPVILKTTKASNLCKAIAVKSASFGGSDLRLVDKQRIPLKRSAP